jgi:hypothetical protein
MIRYPGDTYADDGEIEYLAFDFEEGEFYAVANVQNATLVSTWVEVTHLFDLAAKRGWGMSKSKTPGGYLRGFVHNTQDES